MMEMADFYLGVCLRKVSDQDLEKVTTKVLETFHGVENLTAESRDGIAILYVATMCRGFYQWDLGSHCYFN